LWGSLSQLPFYAVDRLDAAFNSMDDAIDAFAERHSSALDATEQAFNALADRVEVLADFLFDESPSEASAEERREEPEVSAEQRERARELVAEFCGGYSEPRVAPSEEELEALRSRCSLLYSCVLDPGPLAEAFSQQLAQDEAWQPRLRALVALGHLHRADGVGKELAAATARRAGGHIRRLAELPGCAEASGLASELLGEASALDGHWTNKRGPGLRVEVIERGTLRRSDGTSAELTPCGLNLVSAPLGGAECHAELLEGELLWSSGEVWVRDTRSAAGGPRFVVAVEKSSSGPAARLGLEIAHKDGKELVVLEVSEGLIAQWNTDNPGSEVVPGDCICAVNGVKGDSAKLVEAISTSKQLELLLARPQPSGAPDPAVDSTLGQRCEPAPSETVDLLGLSAQDAPQAAPSAGPTGCSLGGGDLQDPAGEKALHGPPNPRAAKLALLQFKGDLPC